MMAAGERFTLELELSSAAIQTFEDVALILHEVADAVGAGRERAEIHDARGNLVGRWGFTT
jgi:hypothetical protein